MYILTLLQLWLSRYSYQFPENNVLLDSLMYAAHPKNTAMYFHVLAWLDGQ